MSSVTLLMDVYSLAVAGPVVSNLLFAVVDFARAASSTTVLVGAYAAHRLLYVGILVVLAPSVVNARCSPEWLRRAKADTCPFFPEVLGGGL